MNKSLAIVKHFFPKVEKVIDTERPAIVEVTEADKRLSKQKDHEVCAFALACKRSFRADGVIIGLTTAYIIKGKTAERYMLAETVSREITSFDRFGREGFDVGFYHMRPASDYRKFGRKDSKHIRTPSNKKGYREVVNFQHFTRGVRTTLGRHEINQQRKSAKSSG